MHKQEAVITGAPAAVGRVTVRVFGERHARVALLARGRDRRETVQQEIEAAGAEAFFFPGVRVWRTGPSHEHRRKISVPLMSV